jgi:low temperature requirement protein LtrA
MLSQWLRVAASDPLHRRTALRYIAGIASVQVLWTAWLWLPDSVAVPVFFVLAAIELVVPVFAELARETPWHRRHIAERYGLFTIIVLGETVLSATTAIEAAIGNEYSPGDLVSLSLAGLVIVFSMWWLYFDQPAHLRLTSLRTSLAWGYGHYLIFASAAAVGAGIEIAVDYDAHTGRIAESVAAWAIPVPVALYLLSVWLLHIGPRNECRPIAIAFPVAVVLVLGCGLFAAPVHLTAVVCAALVLTVVLATRGHRVET